MLISFNWIEDFVDLRGIDKRDLVNKFTLSVAEVEDIIEKGKDISGVITAKIESVNEHPNSKKLHLLKVNTGKGELVDVVCGAPNVSVGLIVPFATLGARVGEMEIREATVGGYASYGMCCSEKELGISEDNSGLMIFPENTSIGVDVKSILEIDDMIFEVDNKSLTNRPDLWGHYGIAREIASLTNRALKPVPVEAAAIYDNLPKLNIHVNSEKCYRYTSVAIENITKKQSPKNMQIRLYYTGMRGINLLADITNYIMLELGQPMHAFDHEIVKKIEVYDVAKDLSFTTLDNQTRILKKDTMVISANGEPVAIAGVMGGLNSEITDKSTSVLVESANFSGVAVRKTATGLGLRTEASSRYEKMLDPELTNLALLRYVYLLKSSDPNIRVVSCVTDIYNKHYDKITISITKDFIDKYIGINIREGQMLQILKSLEFDVKVVNPKEYEIKVPSFRATKDITGRADIVEEITRIYGYDNIDMVSANQSVKPVKLNAEVDYEYRLKHALASKFNLSEVHSYLWNDAKTCKELGINPKSYIKLVNALQVENSDIRSTIIPSLLKTVLDNKMNFNEFGVFEIGSVVTGVNKDNLAIEEKNLGIALYQKGNDYQTMLLKMKNILSYLFAMELNISFRLEASLPKVDYVSPKNFYEIFCDNDKIGEISCIHPVVKNKINSNCEVVVAEINFTKLTTKTVTPVKYEHLSKFPETELDFNFVIPCTSLYSEIEKIAKSVKTELDYRISLIDIYEEESNKSYTLRYVIGSKIRTLTAQDIEAFHKTVIVTFERNKIFLKQA